MKKSVAAVMRLTEITDKLKALDKIETRSAEQDAEYNALDTEQTKVNAEYREAAKSEAKEEEEARLHPRDFTQTPEVREKLDLRSRSRYGRYLSEALLGRPLSGGAEVEYRASLGIIDGIPMDIFEEDRPRVAEIRADAPTTAPAAASGSQSVAWAPHAFADSIAQREFNVSMPAAQSGAWIEPGFSAALTASAKAKGVKQDSTAATVVGLTAKPARIATRQTIQLEDIYSIGNDAFEAALKQQARAALSDELDNQLINGDGVSPNLTGLIKELGNPSGTPSSIATFEDLIEGIGAGIDGKWAYSLRDLRVMVHPDVFKLALEKYRTTESTESAATVLARELGSWKTSSRMPAKVSNISKAVTFRAGRPGLKTAVLPTYATLNIEDPYTDASKGQRHFTLTAIVGDKVLVTQTDAYFVSELKVS